MKRKKVNEGNAFGAAVVKAREEGKKEFEFNGKTYKVRKAKKKPVTEGSIIKLNNQLSDEITKSINMGYDEIKVGMISPKRKGVMLVNDKYQVRGAYPLELQNTIQAMINKIASESVIPKIKKMVREELNRLNEDVRPLYVIAREIAKDWKNVNYAAKPYLQAMATLDSIKDRYGMDSAKSIVSYFLANASSWRGEVAKRIKAELKGLLK